MENGNNLPFKVGDLAEARSFQNGYRGAWFRCKIREITKRKGHIGHVLEYYDFPDEKLKCTRVYQVWPHYVGKAKEKHRELMIRPRYPPIYNEKQMPDVSVISEVTVIIDDSWKVGDLVDWWTTGCYWSGSIIQLLGYDKAKIALKSPPLGEGSVYEVLLKDIRPSLDWSLESGWTITTQRGDTGRCCARLIKPINQVLSMHFPPPILLINSADIRAIVVGGRVGITGQESESNLGTRGSSVGLSFSALVSDSSNSLAVSDEVKSMGTTERKTSVELAEKNLKFNCPLKDRANGGNTLNSMQSDTLEAPVLDLEEYINKIKWLKAMLHNGISSSDARTPKWEFVEPNAPSENPK